MITLAQGGGGTLDILYIRMLDPFMGATIFDTVNFCRFSDKWIFWCLNNCVDTFVGPLLCLTTFGVILGSF